LAVHTNYPYELKNLRKTKDVAGKPKLVVLWEDYAEKRKEFLHSKHMYEEERAQYKYLKTP